MGPVGLVVPDDDFLDHVNVCKKMPLLRLCQGMYDFLLSSFFVFSTSFFYLTRFFRRNNHLEVKKKVWLQLAWLFVKKLKHRSKDPGISHPLPVATGIISFTRFLGVWSV